MSIFKRQNLFSTKRYKELMNTSKSIAVVSASRKLGVTHLCLCLANFLHAALRQKVLYIEVSEDSQLLGMVGEKQIDIRGHIGFLYKGVRYALACNKSEAMELMDQEEGYVILDIDALTDETSNLFFRCSKRIVIGSMKPWCRREFYNLYNNMIKGGQGINIKYVNKNENVNEIKVFKKEFNCDITSLPVIDDPFRLQESSFEDLSKLIM